MINDSKYWLVVIFGMKKRLYSNHTNIQCLEAFHPVQTISIHMLIYYNTIVQFTNNGLRYNLLIVQMYNKKG